MNETECKYWSFDGGNTQRGICAIDNKFCDCLVGERDCYYKQLKRLEAENADLKEENFKLGQFDIKKVTLVENRQLEEENKKLKEKLEKIKHIMNVLNKVGYYKDLEKTVLQIIEGAGDE